MNLCPSSWPPCPRCRSTAHVHRAGLHRRIQFPPAQKFECSRCGKGKKFLKPGEQRHRSGRIRQFRKRIQLQPQVPGTSGSWKIKPELVKSLIAMFRASSQDALCRESLDKFASELIEIAIADFRVSEKRLDPSPLGRKPAARPPERGPRQHNLSARELEKIRDLLKSGVGHHALAQRFAVSRATISRELHANGNEH
jgi:transposase-like protein